MTRRILYLTHTPPWPPDSGGSQRSLLLLRALRQCGDVELLMVTHDHRFTPEQEGDLRRECAMVGWVQHWERSQHWPWRALRAVRPGLAQHLATAVGRVGVDYAPDPAVHAWLRARVAQRPYDLIVGRYLRPTAMGGAFAHGPVVVDIDDLDTSVLETRMQASAPGSLRRAVLRFRLAQMRRIIPRLLAQCRHVWVASPDDQALVAPTPSTVLPNIPYPPEEPGAAPPPPPPPAPEGSGGQVVLMVATMSHMPNRHGLQWFLDEVWPRVRAACPRAVFRLAGGGLSPADMERLRALPGVEPLGFVTDLRPAYAACAITAVPVLEGGGTVIKVLESLRFGRTCVVTPHAHRGHRHTLRDGEALLVGADAAAFAACCIELLNDPGRRDALAQRGRALVLEHYTFARFTQAVREVVEQVCPR